MSYIPNKILARETAGLARCGEIVRVAVPCARGDFRADQPPGVVDPAGQPLPCQNRVLKEWPDGSVKWLLVDFPASVEAGGTTEYHVQAVRDTPPIASPVKVEPGGESWLIDSGRAFFTIDTRVFRPFSSVQFGKSEVLRPAAGTCLLSMDGETELSALVEEIALEETGPLRAVIRLAGRFDSSSAVKAGFFCRLHFLAGSSAVKFEFTLHNPTAARHRGGLWDLGDEGSLLFNSLTFSFPLGDSGGETHCVPAPGTAPLTIPGSSPLSLYQESSGGENWRSPVHRNREGRVPLERRGYVAEADGKEVTSGLRATPVVWHGNGDKGLAVAVPFFWQEFPAEIAVEDGILRYSQFPARFPDLHELQGGEQKTQEFWVDFATEREGLAWVLTPLSAHAAPAVYRQSGIFHDLPGENDLVDRFSSAQDLLAKREASDEYGWRNFGEIYADHEAVFHKGGEPFVSHYNNQYDFIAGLYRKFFATGDPGWGELARDLSRHVRDIDIYHTDGDREEYNNGLFWHTDHYIDAGLSSHRSFSREHLQSKEPHLCGGGPGAEHCYTTGLMYHYFQTGNNDFKQAVIDLAEWELKALKGPQTVLAVLKKSLRYVKMLRSTGNETRPIFPRHPLTRGTGNALTACLDAYEVSGDNRFLAEAEGLIRGALHPDDDIDARNLLDAEVAWSYTVLLVAVAKFLNKKGELGQFDAGYEYARTGLLAYAEWMLIHEYPYLEKPAILEYPNETWAAQDLRKSVIFYHAAHFCNPDRVQAFIQRARFFFEASANELAGHTSSCFARPVVLMLQNGWVGSRLTTDTVQHFTEGSSGKFEKGSAKSSVSGQPTPYLTIAAAVTRIASELLCASRETSIQRELAWLKARVS